MAASKKTIWLRLGLIALILFAIADFARFIGCVKALEVPVYSEVDGIVALTGGSGHRIKAAVKLLDELPDVRLLVSGVHESIEESVLITASGGDAALFECCIDIGHVATSTIGNAEETALWVAEHDVQTLLIVTSDYHMPRSLLWFKRHIKDANLIGYPVETKIKPKKWWVSWTSFRGLVTEWLKYRVSSILLVV